MSSPIQDALRQIPSTDAVLQTEGGAALAGAHGREPAANAIRAALDDLRQAIRQGRPADPTRLQPAAVLEAAEQRLIREGRMHLRRAINATGVILHTGLGRAVFADAARQAVAELTGCCNLQMDLETGERHRREACLEDLARRLFGSEHLVVVNNNAAATLLLLRALAAGREVIVSRGELIEIGGAFRLPDVMRESGAVLREVGTTNKTHLRDYAQAITPQTAMLLKVHQSNYRIVGFSQDVELAELVSLGRQHGIPVVFDLGSGNLLRLEPFGLPHEPTVQGSLEAGADLVLFSTDKLIGGPQGGIITGRQDLVAALRSHPLYRPLRVGKMTLAALEATLRLFLAPDLLCRRHPTLRMLLRPLLEIERQARELRDRIAAARPGWTVTVVEEASYLGGGALPATPLPTWAVRLTSPAHPPQELARRLRLAEPSVIARIRDEALLLDMRTVQASEVEELARAVAALIEP